MGKYVVAISQFQFHTGTIEVCIKIVDLFAAVIIFQFHTGTIEVSTSRRYSLKGRDFNSTLVRLRCQGDCL